MIVGKNMHVLEDLRLAVRCGWEKVSEPKIFGPKGWAGWCRFTRGSHTNPKLLTPTMYWTGVMLSRESKNFTEIYYQKVLHQPTHRIHGNGIFTYWFTIKNQLNVGKPTNQPTNQPTNLKECFRVFVLRGLVGRKIPKRSTSGPPIQSPLVLQVFLGKSKKSQPNQSSKRNPNRKIAWNVPNRIFWPFGNPNQMTKSKRNHIQLGNLFFHSWTWMTRLFWVGDSPTVRYLWGDQPVVWSL